MLLLLFHEVQLLLFHEVQLLLAMVLEKVLNVIITLRESMVSASSED